ncbi:hypothetical protein [Scytonema sp. PCC 10023]|uniref:hypothetical protein n=1 Tax=Scytonema sp. PCC 10023 TaxID=1680591 RepID=UPI0039C725AF
MAGEKINIVKCWSNKEPSNADIVALIGLLIKHKIRYLFANRSAELVVKTPRFTEIEFINIPDTHIESAYVLISKLISDGNLAIADEYKILVIEELRLFNLKQFKEDRERYPIVEALMQGLICAEFQHPPDWSVLNQYSDDDLNYQSNMLTRHLFG